MMLDPNFRRTVVLVCEYTTEGAFGLILNRPLDVSLAEVIPGIANRELSLLQGGPVQADTLHFIHTRGDLVPGTISVSDGIYWGGEFEAMKMLVDTGEVTAADVRFFLGYAGWSAGQLADEVEQGGWILSQGDERLIFDAEPSDLWRKVLRTMGDEYAVLANFPEDPRLN